MSQAISSKQSPAIELKASDLNNWGGIFCPSPKAGMAIKNNHPRVQVQVAATGEGRCPYCSTVFRLKAGEKLGGH